MTTTWIQAPIEDIATKVGSGATPRGGSTAYAAEGTPLIRSMNVVFFGFKRAGLAHLNPDQAEDLAGAEVAAGDVLLNITGASIGRVTVAPPDMSGARVNQHVSIIRPADGIDSRYLAAFLSSPQAQADIATQQYGVTRQALTKSQLLAMSIPVAPYEEQKRIADKLDALLARVDACRERLDRIPAILKRFRQSVLAAATSGELTADWREERGTPAVDSGQNRIPSTWYRTAIGLAGSVQLGRQRSPKYHAGAHMRPYLRVQNVFEDFIDLDDVMEMDFPPPDFERYQLISGDILLNEGQSPHLLGRPAMYRDDLPGACFTNTLIRFRAANKVLPDYALLVFRHYFHNGRFTAEGSITTNIAHLGAGRFAAIEFPVPPLDEQAEICLRAHRLLDAGKRAESSYSLARSHAERVNASLLAKAFRGELVDQDPNDEPASVLLERIRAARVGDGPKAGRGRKMGGPRFEVVDEVDAPTGESMEAAGGR